RSSRYRFRSRSVLSLLSTSRSPPRPTLFPYTTLFRSVAVAPAEVSRPPASRDAAQAHLPELEPANLLGERLLFRRREELGKVRKAGRRFRRHASERRGAVTRRRR